MRRGGRLALWGAAAVALCAVASPPSSLAAEGEAFVWDKPAWLPPPFVPEDNPMTAEKVLLGRHLFYDARLSADDTIACVSCHLQERGFADGRPLPVGVHATPGVRNAPGLTNVAYFPTLTWANPNLDSLEVQSLLPMFGDNPDEMGLAGREEALFARLGADPVYADLFPRAFPEEEGAITLFTLTRALAAFQRTLISARSAYDLYKYEGQSEAMSAAALRGEDLFFDHALECYHCHSGFNFTNNLRTGRSAFTETAFHNTALYNTDGQGAYPLGNTGLLEVTDNPDDMGRFRTPTLRNVAVSGPYMHDGSLPTLEEVIRHYEAGGRRLDDGPHAGDGAQNPLKDPLIIGFTLTDNQRGDLIAFLESLTDTQFLTTPAFADPWPEGHPARATRQMPLPLSQETP